MPRKRMHVGALTVVGLAAAAFAPTHVAAQGAPTVLYGCYVPTSGTVYRIRAEGLPPDCKSKNHVEFTWSLQGPPGPQGSAGPAGPQGPQGPSLSYQYTQTQTTIPPLGLGNLVAVCLLPRRAISGGFFATDPVKVSYNGPPKDLSNIPIFSRWSVTAANESTTDPVTLTVWAYCYDPFSGATP